MAPKDTALNEAISVLEQQLFTQYPESEKLYHTISSIKNFVTPVGSVISTDQYPQVGKQLDIETIVTLIFDKNAPVTDFVLFSLYYSNHVLKAKDIETVIRKFYPSFDKGLSTPIFKLKDNDVIDSYNPTTSLRNVYYGLKSWFKEPGKVKEEYLTQELKDDLELFGE